MLPDELDGRRPAFPDLLLLLEIGGGRKADALVVEAGAFEEPPARIGGRAVRPGREAAVHVAGADAQLQHHRRVARLGKLEPLLDGAHHGREAGPRVEEPHLRLQGEGVASFLDDARPVAVVLADHDEGAAGDPGGREVRERVGGDVGAHRGLPHRTAAHRVVDGRGEHGARRRFVRTRLHVHPERIEDFAGVVEHVHHVGDRRPLVAADVGHPGLEQGLGDRENAFPVEHLAVGEAEAAYLLREASFRHVVPLPVARPPPTLSAIIGTSGRRGGRRRPLDARSGLPERFAVSRARVPNAPGPGPAGTWPDAAPRRSRSTPAAASAGCAGLPVCYVSPACEDHRRERPMPARHEPAERTADRPRSNGQDRFYRPGWPWPSGYHPANGPLAGSMNDSS